MSDFDVIPEGPDLVTIYRDASPLYVAFRRVLEGSDKWGAIYASSRKAVPDVSGTLGEVVEQLKRRANC